MFGHFTTLCMKVLKQIDVRRTGLGNIKYNHDDLTLNEELSQQHCHSNTLRTFP